MRVIHRTYAILSVVLLMATTIVIMGGSGSRENFGVQVVGRPICSEEAMYDPYSCFVENIGQWDVSVRFIGRTSFGFVYLLNDGVCYQIVSEETAYLTRVRFEGSKLSSPSGRWDAGYPTNFFIGNDPSNWVKGARSYREVIYDDVWPDADIRYYYNGTALKYDIDLGASSDPGDIEFGVVGSEGMNIMGRSVELSIDGRTSIFDSDLMAYTSDGLPVRVGFRRIDDDSYGFDIRKEQGGAVTIDPLVFSTVIAGVGEGSDTKFCVDRWNNTILFGHMIGPIVQVTPGAYNNEPRSMDTFVLKMNGNGTGLVFSTIIGGWHMDLAGGLDIDDNGDLYLSGQTYSKDYPTTPGAYQETFCGDSDIFLTKLDSTGSFLEWSTYVGGESHDHSDVISVTEDMILIGGDSMSKRFITPAGPLGGIHGIAILIILDPNATTVTHATQWDGINNEYITDLEVDSDGDVILCGGTSSPNFPITSHSVQRFSSSKDYAAIVMKYNTTTGSTVFSSRFSGDGNNFARDLELDRNDDIYFAGTFDKYGQNDYPVTPGAVDVVHGDVSEGFLTKISSDGTEFVYSTLLGGSSNDSAVSLELDAAGNAFVAGRTMSPDFPVADGSFDTTLGGTWDGWIVKINADATAILNSTFLGMDGDDGITGSILDSHGDLRVLGETTSADYPITSGSYTYGNISWGGAFITILPIQSVPSRVTGLRALEGDASIELTWGAPLDDGASEITGYRIYRGNSDRNMTPYAQIGNALDFTDDNLTVGLELFYSISSLNVIGEGPLCDPVSNISSTLPSPPLNLRAEPMKNEIYLTFDPPTFSGGVPPTGYTLFRDGISVRNFTEGDLVYHDYFIEKGNYYTYTAMTWNRNGPSMMCDPVIVRSLIHPTPPRNLTGRSGTGYIELSWDPPLDDGGRNVQRYEIYRALSNSEMNLIEQIPADRISYRDDCVLNGSIHYYEITAVNEMGTSSPSGTVSCMPPTLPDPPKNLDIVEGDRLIELSWSGPLFDGGFPIIAYNVYHQRSFEDPRLLTTLDPNTTTLKHTGLVPGEVHYYYITSVNSVGESQRSEEVHGFAQGIPSQPRNVEAIPGDGSIELRWGSPGSNGFSPLLRYNVYRRVQGSSYGIIGSTQVTSLVFLDSTVESGIIYHYTIKALNVHGESLGSSERSAIALGHPDRPRNVEAVSKIDHIELKWDTPLDTGGLPISAYLVFRKGPDDGLVKVRTLDGNSTVCSDYAAERGVEYGYHVLAINEIGSSPPSETVLVVLIGRPDRPMEFEARLMEGRVVLRWEMPKSDGGASIEGYSVFRKNGSGPDVMIASISAYARSIVDEDISPGNNYSYGVVAVNVIGEGERSETVSVEIPVPEPEERERAFDYTLPLSLLLVLLVLSILAVLVVRSFARKERYEFPEPVHVMVWEE